MNLELLQRLAANLLVLAALSCAAILFGACSSPAPATTTLAAISTETRPTAAAASPAPPTATPPPPPSPTAISKPVPTASALASRTPTAASRSQLSVIATGLSSPDDLVLGPDHLIYLTDVVDGTVSRVESGGAVTRLLSGLSEPEGMVFLPDGSLLVAEQGRNRIMRWDPNAQKLSLFLQLQNRTGRMGVDGIAWDASSGSLLVPDSPNGTLLRVSADGKQTQLIASGFARPTGAAVQADGSIVVADENGAAVLLVPAAGGTPRVLARPPVPDDVAIGPDGFIYVNTLNEGAIHRIDPATGQGQIVIGGLSNPQGIAFDGSGQLVIAEAGRHRLVRLAVP